MNSPAKSFIAQLDDVVAKQVHLDNLLHAASTLSFPSGIQQEEIEDARKDADALETILKLAKATSEDLRVNTAELLRLMGEAAYAVWSKQFESGQTVPANIEDMPLSAYASVDPKTIPKRLSPLHGSILNMVDDEAVEQPAPETKPN